MGKILFRSSIMDQNSSIYTIPFRDLFLFLWKTSFRHHTTCLNASCHGKEVYLYKSRNVQLITNLCLVVGFSFFCFIIAPAFIVVAPIISSRMNDVLAAAIFTGCSTYASYAVNVLVACLIVPHVRWLTLTPDVDPADFHFQIEKNRNIGMRIVWPILIIEIVLLFVIFHGCFSSGGVLIS